MPATPAELAILRSNVRAARHALFALSTARRAELLRDRPAAQFLAPITAARAALRTARALLAAALAS